MKKFLTTIYFLALTISTGANVFGETVNDTVTVPPGHKVVVVHPSSAEKVFITESGLIIIDLGRQFPSEGLFSKLESQYRQSKTSILWIVQNELIELVEKNRGLEDFMGMIKEQFQKYSASQIAVFPLNASDHTSLMQSFKDIGFGVHFSAEDGACFVEVHKPDGKIEIGMPGSEY